MGAVSTTCCTNLQKNLLLEQEISTSDMAAMQISTMEEIEKGRIAPWSKPGHYSENLGVSLACCSNPVFNTDGSVGGFPAGTVAATGDGGQIIAMSGVDMPGEPQWTFEQQGGKEPITAPPKAAASRAEARPDPGLVRAPRSVM
mmetsp:Transcript_30776/g.71906  ORF Transcript_30776/g.71906 Transcript_30776/m.71906 type:complete len:144 (-) Transcript_30776:4-435(-)